ncbi:MAG: hypothetical protein AAF959_02185 [Cyanobacteria bacterium P01_D01_bin.56]
MELVNIEGGYYPSSEDIIENGEVLTLQPDGQSSPLHIIKIGPNYCGSAGCTFAGYIQHGEGYRSVLYKSIIYGNFTPLNQFDNGLACLNYAFRGGDANTCYNGFEYGDGINARLSSEPPAIDIKNYRNEAFGFSFQVPTNRRTMLLRHGNIDVVDQEEFEWRQELARSDRGAGYGYSLVSVFVTPVGSSNRSLAELVRANNQGTVLQNAQLQDASVSGQPAVSHTSYNDYHGLETTYVYLLTPDGRNLIQISGPTLGAELGLGLSTFKFE